MLDELILFSRGFNILVMSRDFIFIKLILPLSNSLSIYIWTRRTAAVATFSEGQIVLGAVSRVQSVCYELPAGSPIWMVLELIRPADLAFQPVLIILVVRPGSPAIQVSHELSYSVFITSFSFLIQTELGLNGVLFPVASTIHCYTLGSLKLQKFILQFRTPEVQTKVSAWPYWCSKGGTFQPLPAPADSSLPELLWQHHSKHHICSHISSKHHLYGHIASKHHLCGHIATSASCVRISFYLLSINSLFCCFPL